jgi:hypothetical protein
MKIKAIDNTVQVYELREHEVVKLDIKNVVKCLHSYSAIVCPEVKELDIEEVSSSNLSFYDGKTAGKKMIPNGITPYIIKDGVLKGRYIFNGELPGAFVIVKERATNKVKEAKPIEE